MSILQKTKLTQEDLNDVNYLLDMQTAYTLHFQLRIAEALEKIAFDNGK